MLAYLQRIGRSLMVPVAVLPAAAILMGIGYWIEQSGSTDFAQLSVLLVKAGGSLINNMGLLFAVGIGFGLSKDKHGSAALTALIGWLVVQTILAPSNYVLIFNVAEAPAAFGSIDNQFIGIIVGVLAAEVYNRTYKVQLTPALSFFSGRRLSSIIMAVVGLLLSLVLAFVWPVIFNALVSFGEQITSLGSLGAGIFGFFNRMLIPLGLHHALNSVFWFDVANINDISNFLSGVGTPGVTGMYLAGFFPIMMFGLPAAAFAMYQEALPENKKKVAGILLAGAVASFFTGVTEPLEFSFLFVAPILFVLHALLTGLSLFISAQFEWISGFGFSAGFVDYVLAFKNPLAVNNLMLIVQGIGFAAFYYVSFRFLIRFRNLKTIGRTKGEFDEDDSEPQDDNNKDDKRKVLASKIIKIIGEDNLTAIDNCTTRLRLEVKDSNTVDLDAIKKLGVVGALKPSNTSLQIIIGPDVQFMADEMNRQAGSN